MPLVVGVRFRSASKLHHLDPGDLDLHRLDRVIVETATGIELGRVVTDRLEKPDETPTPLRRVLRKATEEDMERQRQRQERAAAALALFRQKVAQMRLAMRPVDAELSFDRNRLLLFYTAEERLDFRALARDMAQELRVRVELRQVGARDEAKLIDGIGPCGEQLCCARWMTEFQPISIKMAKLQNLALNPGKLAGACGRLKCCLRFEIEAYEEGRKQLPAVGATVQTRAGVGRVVAVNPLDRSVSVAFDGSAPQTFDYGEVFGQGGPGGCGADRAGGTNCGSRAER